MSTLGEDAQNHGAAVGLLGDRITIRGGTPLVGRIELKGAKNLVTKAMVAALLGESPSVLKDVPNISDVRIVRGLLEVHGVKVTDGDEPGELILDPVNVESAHYADIDAHAGSSRIPILFCGPLLHHLDVLRKFGAVVEKQANGIRMSAPNGLKGTKVDLPYPSVGATEQVLLTAVRAEGITELKGAAIEPEIMDLINILQKMGAIITVDTDRVIRIEGVERLEGYQHRALFDRNEAASWAAAALATDGDIFVGGARQAEMITFLNVFRKVGGAFDIHDDGIRFYHPGGELKPVIIETDVHPGFMTDWQQPLVIALTKAHGVSIVHETVYEQRFGFVDALVEMGATIQIHKECLGGHPCRFGQRNFNHSAVITGPTKLHGADIEVPDLRGGFSHLIAALSAEGTSTVSNVGIIARGYENFITKLELLGADFDLEG